MRISIVTISYNQSRFLESAIRSVLSQNYDDLEYIVVDAGSVDGSREIINRYRSQITKIIYEPDKGAADGLNKGFKYASGEIFGFLNSDDLLLPGALNKVGNYYQQHPEYDIISGHSLIIDGKNMLLRKSYSDHFALLGYAYGGIVLMQPSTFFRQAIFRRTKGFNVQNKTNWDGELWVAFYRVGACFGIIDEFLSCYRLHRESITGTKVYDQQIRSYNRRIFIEILHRDRRRYDLLIELWFLVVKYLKEPRSLLERITHGRIYRRNISLGEK